MKQTPPVDAGVRPSTFRPSPLPDVTRLGLPVNKAGLIVLAQQDGAELSFDPATAPNPMSARIRCSDWLMQCFEESGSNIDSCLREVPRCATERPWEETEQCCPTQCVEEYGAARASGAEPMAAWLAVFAGDLACIPGYSAWVAGELQ